MKTSLNSYSPVIQTEIKNKSKIIKIKLKKIEKKMEVIIYE